MAPNDSFPGSAAFEALKQDYASIEMFGSVDEYETSIAAVPRESLAVFAAMSCSGEVINGGFRQFFRNTTGILAPEAAEGFELLGFHVCANALRDAMGLFGEPYPRDRWERHRLIEELEFPGGDPKLVTEYDADINALLNKWHLMTRRPLVEPFVVMDDLYYSVARVDTIGAAADAYVARDRG